MKITVEQALIKTAAIEIKALTINNRQVTLALFRQLDYGKLIDHALLRLNGPVWGRVNYHAGCKDLGEHLHLIWQEGTELKQDMVMPREFDNVKYEYRGAVNYAMERCIAFYIFNWTYWNPEWSRWGITDLPDLSIPKPEYHENFYLLNRELVRYYRGHIADLRSKKEAGEKLTDWELDEIEHCIKTINEKRQKVKEEFPEITSLSKEELQEKALAAKRELDAYKAGSQKLYQQLEAVDHLFIAA